MPDEVMRTMHSESFECIECDCRFSVVEPSGEEHKAVEFCPKCGEPAVEPIDEAEV